ncbi:MAG TPA: transposase [Acidimicrobiia bacterium]
MAEAYETRVRSLRRLIKLYDAEISKLDARISDLFEGHEGYGLIQQLNGVGPVLAAIFCAELGDVTRFGSAKQVCSWAGLTPRHRESDTTVHRGSITITRSTPGPVGCHRSHLQEPRRRPHQSPLPTGF